MTDDLINLLPDELRASDQTELDAPIQKSAPISYSQVAESKELPQDSFKEFSKSVEKKSPPSPTMPVETKLVDNLNQVKPSSLEQILAPTPELKPKLEQISKVNPLPVNRAMGSAKTKATTTINDTQPVKKSWLAFWLKFFSIKPKSSTLDNASTRTDGNLSFDVNLVPRSTYNLPGNILGLRLILAAMIVVFLVSGIHWLFALFNQTIIQKVMALQTVLDNNQKAIQSYKDLTQQLNQLEVQSRSIDGLISKHIYWTQFLTKLESLTLPNVYYAGMTADPNGSVNLQVVAPTYTDAAQQLLFWQDQPEIKKMEFSGLSGNSASGEVNLSVKLELDPVIFYKN